jgi:predicted PurR-regulated permease PerM
LEQLLVSLQVVMARRRGGRRCYALVILFFLVFVLIFSFFFLNFTLSINQIRHDFFYMDHDISRQVTRQRTSKDFEEAVEST